MRMRLVAAMAVLSTSVALAQSYPSRPIEMIIPFTAGSGLDINGRAIASALSKQLKQSVVVVNRDGAAGTIGFGAMAAANPDGYTIGFGPTTPISTSPHLMKGVRYDADSFSYICQIFETVFVLAVGPSSKISSFPELLAEAKAKPNTISYGTAGVGTVPHLSMVNLEQVLGVQFLHVPHRGDAPLFPALLRGDIDLAVTAIASVREQPDIRALASFSDERTQAYPNVPTVKELGVARSVPPGQVGLFAQKGIAPQTQQLLEKACEAASADETVQRVIVTTGQVAKYRGGPQFHDLTVEDHAFKGKLIKSLQLKND